MKKKNQPVLPPLRRGAIRQKLSRVRGSSTFENMLLLPRLQGVGLDTLLVSAGFTTRPKH
ncbi:hypothetical protein HanRHA438_Chr15g0708621 [Helianthus annuus]|nr:hypothetical protein HanRHA438_Chr15g0708621 [Helianthus annuus]